MKGLSEALHRTPFGPAMVMDGTHIAREPGHHQPFKVSAKAHKSATIAVSTGMVVISPGFQILRLYQERPQDFERTGKPVHPDPGN